MSLARLYSGLISGVRGEIVTVEIHIDRGLPGVNIVGLPDQAVKESRERIRPAIKESGFDFPNNKITINLSPADKAKEGSTYDLPIALGILIASGQLEISPVEIEDKLLAGEIALDGSLRGIPGVLPLAIAGDKNDFLQMFTPPENYLEVEPTGLKAVSVPHLRTAVAILEGRLDPEPPAKKTGEDIPDFDPRDFADVKGQPTAKKALCTAAAGGHNALMIGPPGTGKSMLASRLPGILPSLTQRQALATTAVHSVAGELLKRGQLIDMPPFRTPHHTISGAGLIGGGQNPRPGEASLAHHGVLFLDELPEFQRNILETLRQPMETGEIHISRARTSCHFPANFLLLGAMNPCPCGFLTHPERQCICTPSQIDRYRRKLSGPLLDRIDLHLSVGPISYDQLTGEKSVKDTATMRSNVTEARNRQRHRYEDEDFFVNAELPARKIKEFCSLDSGAESLLKQAVDSWGYSARTVHRLQKVGRTLADIEGTERIIENQMAEALNYREFELDGWQR